MTLAAGPVMRTFTIGPEISSSSKPPPPVPAQMGSRQAKLAEYILHKGVSYQGSLIGLLRLRIAKCAPLQCST